MGPVATRDRHITCPFKLQISQDTALLESRLRRWLKDRMFYSLSLQPRCLHCDVTRLAKRSESSQLVKDLTTGPVADISRFLSSSEVKKAICRASSCRREVWLGVGLYCEMHYAAISNVCRRGTHRPMLTKYIRGLDPVRTLSRFLTHRFASRDSYFKAILSAILDPDPDGPRVYAVDTEFHRAPGANLAISEVAFVDAKSGKIVVDAILGDKMRGVAANQKLLDHKASQRSSTSRNVCQVHTVPDMFKQIEDCRIRPETDIIVEWSLNRQQDIDYTHLALRQYGHDGGKVLPMSSFRLIKPVQTFLEQVMKLGSSEAGACL